MIARHRRCIDRNPNSTDRLKRVANIPRYAIKPDSVDNVDGGIVDHDTLFGGPCIMMDSPLATLLRCHDHLFLCIEEIIDIVFQSKHSPQLPLEFLNDPTVFVTFQVLKLVPATDEDDPEHENDWRWSHSRGSSYRVPGHLVQPINPAISTRVVGKPFYLFQFSCFTPVSEAYSTRHSSDKRGVL
jgi:hypothetical protein